MSKNKFFATTATAALVASAIVPAASAAELNDFDTVPAYAKEAVKYLADNNFVQGDENQNFKPASTLLRAQAAEIISKVKGLDATGTEDFSDVKAGDWFYNAVVATSPEIFEGNGAGQFNPTQKLTRQEAAQIIVKAFGLTGSTDLSDFADASKVPAWAQAAFETAVANEVINGKNGKLAPQDNISNAEFAVMIKRAIDASAPVVVETPEVTSVSAIDATTMEVKIAGELTDAQIAELTFEFDPALEVTKVERKAAEAFRTFAATTSTTVVLTTAEQAADTTYNLVGVNGTDLETKVEVEAPVAPGLAVESVTAIESTIVEVTFPELTEAVTETTVEVKDSKGVVREVVARDIAKGATKAQFDFETAVKADELTGVWTVNGVTYSFDELELVEDIVTEAGKSPVNQVKLYNLLIEAGIKNVDADTIATYAEDIVDADTTPVWASDIQKIVDQTNKDASKKANEAAIVKAVADATNQIQLLNVLEANFDRVNPNWIADYATKDVATKGDMVDLDTDNYAGKTDAVTTEQIQAAIDQVNADAIAVDEADADTATEQAAVTTLIEKWVKADNPDTPKVTPKADAIKASKAKEAAFRVAEATTENSLYNALVAYANATPDATMKSSELNSNLKTEYKNALDSLTKDTLVATVKSTGAGHDDATDGIKAKIVTTADTAAVNAAINSVGTTATAYDGAKTDAAKKAAFQKALQKLADVTSHKTGDNKFDASKVNVELLEQYAAVVKGFTDSKTVKNIQDAIQEVNAEKDITNAADVVNDINSTATQVRDALTTIAVVEKNTNFINLSATAKLEVAELVIAERPTNGFEAVPAEPGPAKTVEKVIDAEITAQISARGNLIDEVNAVNGTNLESAAFDYTTVDAALTALDHEGYDALTGLARINAAQEFYNNMPIKTKTDGSEEEVEYTTLTAIKADIDKAVKSAK